MRFAALLTATALAALPFAAHAQNAAGPYVGIGAGANWTTDSDITGLGAARSVEYDTGWLGALTAGYHFGNGFRGEIEGAYRRNSLDTISNTGATGVQDGRTQGISGMLNVLYDFKTGSAWVPYLGAGIGMAKVSMNAKPLNAALDAVSDSDVAFAYQGIAGIGYNINQNAQVFADYRYFATQDLDFRTKAGTAIESEYANHAVMIGLRWNFGAPKPTPVAAPMPAAQPAPPPPPAPAPVAAPKPKNYLVFFDFDKSNLTAEAQRIVQSAAGDAKAGKVTRIVTTGHADRSGKDAYNMKLSQRRADAVKKELIRLGIADKDISVTAKGESEPLVPTPDGVREPQNRRVEIVLQ